MSDADGHLGPPLSAEDRQRFGPDPLNLFRSNLAAVEDRIRQACARAGRDAATVRLLPVTKTVPAAVLRIAYAAGIRSFGENKIQEAEGKHDVLSDLPVHWSIIGHLQTNKAKHLVRFAEEFHALDSLRLADHLNRRLDLADRSLDVFIQVNTSGEASKYGMHPDELLPFIKALDGFPRLRPRGLMTLAVFSADMDKVRPCFRLLRRLRDQAAQERGTPFQLSMGMSGDFEAAIEEGADIVRVGQAIFGKRPTPDGHYWPG